MLQIKNGILGFTVIVLFLLSSGFRWAEKGIPLKPAPRIDTVINDDFISKALSRLSLLHVTSSYQFLNRHQQTSANIHIANAKDTLVTLTNGADSFAFLKSGGGNVTLITATITTNKLSVDNDVVVGALATTIAQKFRKTHVTDQLIITDLEQGNIFTLSFNPAGKLIKIQYRAQYVD